MSDSKSTPAELIQAGIRHCRRGEWHSGLHFLKPLMEREADTLTPSVAWSYLGHALERCEHRHAEALALCARSLELGSRSPTNYLNMAWVHLLAHDRPGAARAVLRGLAVDESNAALLEMHRRVGVRRTPVLAFLPRSHSFNVLLGRLRHAMTKEAWWPELALEGSIQRPSTSRQTGLLAQ